MDWFRKFPTLVVFILGFAIPLLTANCGGDDKNPVDPIEDPPIVDDNTAPAAVTDLRLRSPTQNTLALVWSAPGDDGMAGTASRYDIRVSKSMITEANWAGATPLEPSLVPSPKPAGQIETIVMTGLESGTIYYFALKTSDEASNESGLSNCCHDATLAETIPPGDIVDLQATAVGETSFELTWTAPGDDYASGTATRYDIRYSPRIIQTELEFQNATPVPNPPAPRIAGERQSFVVSNLAADSYCFAIKTVDEMNNWSGVSNFAVGLGYGEAFWYGPSLIPQGDRLYIVFRANDTGFTRVSIHEQYAIHYCGESLITDLVHDTLPAGIYRISFDFFDEDSGNYLPDAWYSISLCYDHGVVEWRWVGFNLE
ncbi:MAG: hypothetical protein JSW50_06915 [Candidatus Latescibacterota bacterium]|nr:MAG: hypothetical protein JSW50_06915 [Candidatus Latescibacterota bacterium]